MKNFLACACLLVFSTVEASDGWREKTSDNFVVYHKQSEEFGENAVRYAEKCRRQIIKKWFGKEVKWDSRCKMFLHEDQESLDSAAGSAGAPGYTEYNIIFGKRTNTTIHVSVAKDRVWSDIVPHEITHAVMAKYFNFALPKWADEGMAGQAETDEHHRLWKLNVRTAEKYWGVDEIMAMNQYPDNHVTLFYAESVTLVAHMVELKGEKVFLAFIKDAARNGNKQALRKHYHMTYNQLEKSWLKSIE